MHDMRTYRGEQTELELFLLSVVDRGEWSPSCEFALPTRKQSPVPTEQVARWAPEHVSTRWCCSCRELNRHPSVVQPIT